jgi:hypothetical protein
LLVAGVPFTLFGEGGLLGLGIAALVGFVVIGAAELLTPEVLGEDDGRSSAGVGARPSGDRPVSLFEGYPRGQPAAMP